MEFLALLLAIIALVIVHDKGKQIEALKLRLRELEAGAAGPGAPVKEEIWARRDDDTTLRAATEASQKVDDDLAGDAKAPPKVEPARSGDGWARGSRNAGEPDTAPRPAKAARAPLDMEKAIGVHLPVWGGALMLLIAGFFLARMAADNGFFTPTLGVLACAAGALVMLVCAFLVQQWRIANHAQIAAALASAAIGTLYATSFLSSAAFGLTSLFTGFLLSAGTAALAMGIAFTFGRPVLIVGLLGGYLAPFFLIASAPSETLSHLYLAALLVAGTAVCARKDWWNLLTPMILLHFAWLAGFMVVGGPLAASSPITLVMLVATPLAVFFLSEYQGGMRQSNPAATHLSLALALALLIGGAAVAQFDGLYLIAFCTLLVGTGIMTSIGRSDTLTPTIAAAVGWLALLLLWRDPQAVPRLAATLVALVAIALPLGWRLLRGEYAVRAAVTLCVIATATFVATMVDLDGWGGVRDLPYLWAVMALVCSAAAVAANMFFGRAAPVEAANTVRSIFGASASGFVSLAVVAVVDPNYFALAAALQVLGLALVYTRYRADNLLNVAGIYVALYGGLLLVAVVSPLGAFADSVLGPYLPNTAPWDAPVAALLLPALSFLAAATVFARASKAELIVILDGAAVLLLVLATGALILPDLSDLSVADTLLWSSFCGNAVALIGLAALLAGGHWQRRGLSMPGLVVLIGVVGATLMLAALPVYRFWPAWNVQGVPVFNVAITGLIVPGGFALAVARIFRNAAQQGQAHRWLFAIAGGILVLTGLLVDIRHLYHPDLLQGPSGTFERYTYSAGMLLMAFTALILGARLNSQPLRYGSLAIMLATVAKVFLFDIGGLEGLWRVASFVAMGVALLATSWFYGRHVFGKPKAEEEGAPAASATA